MRRLTAISLIIIQRPFWGFTDTVVSFPGTSTVLGSVSLSNTPFRFRSTKDRSKNRCRLHRLFWRKEVRHKCYNIRLNTANVIYGLNPITYVHIGNNNSKTLTNMGKWRLIFYWFNTLIARKVHLYLLIKYCYTSLRFSIFSCDRVKRDNCDK